MREPLKWAALSWRLAAWSAGRLASGHNAAIAARQIEPLSLTHMLATLLAEVTSARRAGAYALLWLLALTILNVQTGGAWRSTILFAVPVALVSWKDWRLGFLVAAVAVAAAKYGGAMPEPGSPIPLWLDALVAFAKLSVDALVVNAWGRRQRRRAAPGSTRP
ncbi:MAG TPA: hypothetical protein VF453_20855 [Burkholderiaceae bacterium]